MRSLVLLASLAAFAGQDPAPTVKEPETGIAFPAWLNAPRGEHTAREDLLGTGAREKTVFKVNVYALGIYADLTAAVPALKKAAGALERKQALKDAGFREVLLRDEIGKSLRWVMARDVGGADIAEAFADSLEPRLKALAKTEAEKKAAAAAAQTLRSYFTAELTEGTELLFHWEPGGRLHTMVGGVKQGVIANLTLCTALFDVYLGSDPISPGARSRVLEGAWQQVQIAAAASPSPAPAVPAPAR